MTRERRILDLAGHAGHILLENGAEIFRVQETMLRILNAYGITDANVYVVSNGIFATVNEHSDSAHNLVRYVPISRLSLCRIDAVNRISRMICDNALDAEAAEAALKEAETLESEKNSLRIIASGFACASFCHLFGGTIPESILAIPIGMLLHLVMTRLQAREQYFTPYIWGAAFVTLLSGLLTLLQPGLSYDHIIIGAIIPLVPGVAFTTSIREFFSGNFLSGVIHLVSALLTAACIGLGVCGGVWIFNLFGVLL